MGNAILVFTFFPKQCLHYGVLALELCGPPQKFLTNVVANLLLVVAKLHVIPQLGHQRHLASKGAPKAVQGGPKGFPESPKVKLFWF